jgi:DNA (cytosine-5)-methyltransferase 1
MSIWLYSAPPQKILDLFCCAGGASMGMHRAFPNAKITGVDIEVHANYPFDFIQADALEFPLQGYDFIWASPPCQHYSSMANIHKNRDKHPALIEPIRKRLKESGAVWVIENVMGAPLKNPMMLCGTMFGLKIPKHRIFETSAPIFNLLPPCGHQDVYDPYHGGEEARGEREKLAKVIGVDWTMTRPEVREAIPPAYSEYLIKTLWGASV